MEAQEDAKRMKQLSSLDLQPETSLHLLDEITSDRFANRPNIFLYIPGATSLAVVFYSLVSFTFEM